MGKHLKVLIAMAVVIVGCSDKQAEIERQRQASEVAAQKEAAAKIAAEQAEMKAAAERAACLKLSDPFSGRKHGPELDK